MLSPGCKVVTVLSLGCHAVTGLSCRQCAVTRLSCCQRAVVFPIVMPLCSVAYSAPFCCRLYNATANIDDDDGDDGTASNSLQTVAEYSEEGSDDGWCGGDNGTLISQRFKFIFLPCISVVRFTSVLYVTILHASFKMAVWCVHVWRLPDFTVRICL